MNWKKIDRHSGSVLKVLEIRGEEVGFIYRPKNTRTDKNAWRIHTGIGESNIFRGHEWTEKDAKNKLIALTNC
jgi:hypothetical protein